MTQQENKSTIDRLNKIDEFQKYYGKYIKYDYFKNRQHWSTVIEIAMDVCRWEGNYNQSKCPNITYFICEYLHEISLKSSFHNLCSFKNHDNNMQSKCEQRYDMNRAQSQGQNSKDFVIRDINYIVSLNL